MNNIKSEYKEIKFKSDYNPYIENENLPVKIIKVEQYGGVDNNNIEEVTDNNNIEEVTDNSNSQEVTDNSNSQEVTDNSNLQEVTDNSNSQEVTEDNNVEEVTFNKNAEEIAVDDSVENVELTDEIVEYKNENNGSTVKSIVFTNNNNLNNIVFDNVENENINKFISSNQNILIEENVALREQDIIYKDDIVYLKELVNEFLSEYKITNQESFYIQKLVEKEAMDTIEIKNLGLIENDMFEKDVEYRLVYNMFYDIFKTNVVIPIVSDKHKIYVNLKENVIENGYNTDNIQNKQQNIVNFYFSKTLEDKTGIEENNQFNQFIELKELIHNKNISKIEYETFLKDFFEISKSYILNNDKLGVIRKQNNDSDRLVLRYNDINTIHWNTYNNDSEYISKKDLFDEKGKIIGQEDNVLIKGNQINIIGFMVLSKDTDYLKKEFNLIGNITKIYNTNDGIIIDCPDHNVKNDEIIYIDNTDCFPPINNIFSESIEVLNKDQIKCTIKFLLLKEATTGNLYKISKLEYDQYNIVKNSDNKLEIAFTKSINNKIRDKTNSNINKAYLFNDVILNKTDYENIIKMIMPNLDDIVEQYKNDLTNIYTYDDVAELFSKYNLTVNNFNVKQIGIIKTALKNNLTRLLQYYEKTDSKNIKLSFNKNYKNVFNSDYFLSNKFITDKNIEKLYTKYQHIGKPEDNLLLRFKWLESQNDHGKYYYLNYLLHQDIDISDKYIKDKKNELNKLLVDLEKMFNKEVANTKNTPSRMYKYQAYKVKPEDGSEINGFDKLKKKLENDTYVFYNNNLYIWKGKLVEIENIENNSLALVGNELWLYQKGEWVKSNTVPKYDNIAYLCSLNNMELDNLKLDKLDCIYRKGVGCQSKIYYRLSDNITRIKSNILDFEKLEENIKIQKENIENQMKDIINKYFSIGNTNNNLNSKSNNKSIAKSNKNNKNNKNETKKNTDSLSILLNLINNINNEDQKLHYIYSLIEKDGIVIDNNIYSKKYCRSMNICGHYYYLRSIDYSNNPNEKIKLYDEMYNKYSDNGENINKIHTCKNCGQNIGVIEYDETEGFADSGMLKKSRENWSEEKIDIDMSKIDVFEHLKLTDMDETYLKEILVKQGLSLDDINNAIHVTNYVTKNLFPKSGVLLQNQDVINIVIDSLQKIKSIIPYSIYKLKEIKKLMDKGISKDRIDDFDSKGKIRESYNVYHNIRKSGIISARFLISVQTCIPNYIKSSKTAICPFTSFDGIEGITYMSCILHEMGLMPIRDKQKSMEMIKLTVEELYNEFKELVHIKKLFKNKKLFDQELSKKKDKMIFSNKDDIVEEDEELIEPVEIDDKYLKLLKDATDSYTVNKLQNVLLNRLVYLSKIIKQTVKNVIGKYPSSDIYSGYLETSCCMENADSFIDYYYFIEEHSDIKVIKYIEESNRIYDLLKYYLNTGTIHKVLLYDKYFNNGVYNNIIVDNQKDTSQNVIKAMFELYVDKGQFAGTMREYVDIIDGELDIKSGLTKKEILSKDYTIEEYQELLENIQKLNVKYYKPNNHKTSNGLLDGLKKQSYENLDKEIQILIKNITHILGETKEYSDKMLNLIRNMGIFVDITNVKYKNMSDKEKIKMRINIEKDRLEYLKTFYISKFKRYLSIIKNAYENTKISVDYLQFITEDDISLEMQNFIYNENQKILPFLGESVCKYFGDIEPSYTNNEINSIHGIDNIYDSKYEKIKKYSDFNFNDASTVVLYIIIKQFNTIITCATSNYDDDLDNNMNVSGKNLKCKYICNFINMLLKEVENDDILFNQCNEGVIKLENCMKHDLIEYYFKEYKKDDDGDYLLKRMRKEKIASSVDELKDDMEKAEMEYLQTLEENDKDYYITEKGKKDFYDKYGYEATEEQLNEYKENYLKQMAEDADIENDENDIGLDPVNEDVIDKGAGYGNLNDFDFETGDGFDYSDQQVYDE